MSLRKTKTDLIIKALKNDWEEILHGDEDLFNEMTEQHMPALLDAAQTSIRQQIRFGHLDKDTIEAEELVNETLIHAWHVRHARSLHKPFKDWLLELQKHALQKIVDQERRLHEVMPVSLDSPNAKEGLSDGENDWEWPDSIAQDHLIDVITDEYSQSFAI